MNTSKDKITTSHWCFQFSLISIKKWLRNFFNNFICFINFKLSLFVYITRSSSWSSKDIKLIAIVNWIFHVSDVLRSFMISFKYGLILLRYSSIDSVLLLLTFFFRIQYICCSKNYLLLLVCNNLVLPSQKSS